MITIFFHPGPITSWNDAKQCDTKAFGRFHRALLAEGVYWPPAQFEAAFISLAHDEAVIDQTVAAAAKAIASV
jgi:glutamate-1-semialdehyde 2,1-aminomutase